MTATTSQDTSRTSHRSTDDDHCALADRAFHLVDIGGAGVGMVTQLLTVRGAQVSGSDAHRGPAFDHLADLGITTHLGHNAASMPERNTVVAPTAIKETSPRLAEARRRDQDVIHRPRALALAARDLNFVAVAGAHGKTTTSGMLAEALAEAGVNPSFVIGGVVRALGIDAHLGSGPALVAEADGSNRSFFNYTPRMEIVTSVESDHLDNYGTAEAFETAFVDFAHRLVPGGLLVARTADAGALCPAQSVAAGDLRVVTYSFADPNTFPGGVLVGEGHVHLDIQGRGASSTRGLLTLTTAADREPAGSANEEPHHDPIELVLTVPEDHVALDTAGTQATGIGPGIEPTLVAQALDAFGGTGRRSKDQGEACNMHTTDDYAYHPTKIKTLLHMARGVAQERGGRILVLFQLHLFSRTRAFADHFRQALALADAVVITDVYPAGGTQADFPDITGDAVAQHVPDGTAGFVVKRLDAAHVATDLACPGDLLLTVGAENVTEFAGTVLGDLAAREGSATPSPADRDKRA